MKKRKVILSSIIMLIPCLTIFFLGNRVNLIAQFSLETHFKNELNMPGQQELKLRKPVVPSVVVVSPNGGEKWNPGSTQTIQWRYLGISASEILGNVTIELLKGGRLVTSITSEASPGTGDSGSYNWEIPLFQAFGNDYQIRIVTARPYSDYPWSLEITDLSNGNFTINHPGKIAFVSPSPYHGDIFILDEAGRRRITTHPADDSSPVWSPNWKKIAFCSYRDNNMDIYVMAPDGSDERRLTNHPAEDREPSWSPDGRMIAFSSNRDGNYEIYIMNSDGSDHWRITNYPGPDKYPAWSPKGDKIAFSSNRDGNCDIYLMNIDGTDLRRITTSSEDDIEPAWSPDGTMIAFTLVSSFNSNIYMVQVDGARMTQLTYYPTRDRHPSWSNDGNKIVFYSNRFGRDQLYVLNFERGSTSIISEESAVEFDGSWTPSPQLIKPRLLFPEIIKKIR